MFGSVNENTVFPEGSKCLVLRLLMIFLAASQQCTIIMLFDLFSCEVIKDQKTEESLQYAFIEFEKVCLPFCLLNILRVCSHVRPMLRNAFSASFESRSTQKHSYRGPPISFTSR